MKSTPPSHCFFLAFCWVASLVRWKGLFVLASGNTAPDSWLPSTSTDTIIHQAMTRIQASQKKPLDQHDRPFVTLAYAQSLDGKMALRINSNNTSSANLRLSGPASQRWTHALRSIHDGILVGGTTWSTDQPRLTNRFWGTSHQHHQPIPIVLDTHLRHIRQYQGNKDVKRRILVCCSVSAALEWAQSDDNNNLYDHIQLVPCQCDTTNPARLDLVHVLQQLKQQQGINTLMIEGGPTVLHEFFTSTKDLFDYVAITVAVGMILGNARGIGPYQQPSLFGNQQQMEMVRLEEDLLLLLDRHATHE